jgi:hypothetical protein
MSLRVVCSNIVSLKLGTGRGYTGLAQRFLLAAPRKRSALDNYRALTHLKS